LRVFAIGTCRVYRSAYKLRQPGLEVVRFPHRVHTLGQIEQGLRYLTRGENLVPNDLVHTLSRRACEILLNRPSPWNTLEKLRTGIPPLAEFDKILIEVSSFREHYAVAGGKTVLINSFVAADLKRHADRFEPLYESGKLKRLTDYSTRDPGMENMHLAMNRLKAFFGKPILWISHGNIVNPTPEEDVLYRSREKTARIVRRGVGKKTDYFYPKVLTEELGRDALFEKNGRDLNHYTPLGLTRMAERLLKWVDPARSLQNAAAVMPDDEEDAEAA